MAPEYQVQGKNALAPSLYRPYPQPRQPLRSALRVTLALGVHRRQVCALHHVLIAVLALDLVEKPQRGCVVAGSVRIVRQAQGGSPQITRLGDEDAQPERIALGDGAIRFLTGGGVVLQFEQRVHSKQRAIDREELQSDRVRVLGRALPVAWRALWSAA